MSNLYDMCVLIQYWRKGIIATLLVIKLLTYLPEFGSISPISPILKMWGDGCALVNMLECTRGEGLLSVKSRGRRGENKERHLALF